jgi:prolyl-tRNA synthetase
MSENDRMVKDITPKSEDFSKWYLDVVRKAQLADYAPVRGCMIIMPYGYALWENMRDILDKMIKDTGHQNAYFPLFIPESFLAKEAEHVEGFAPEVAWVTYGGNEKLEERLAVRPTSEAIICSMYSKWISSWRDLPVLINQWANIVRWEKVTRPFLRTLEFLWQEGHTVHETAEEGLEETLKMLDVYETFYRETLAVPVIKGVKSDKEKFAGALKTYAVEAMMWDGKALQGGTSHNLGQNFAKAFNIRFEDRNQQLQYGWSTSWGMSTRIVGAVIMTHGDDSGLILPPKVAPHQVVIVPITSGKNPEQVIEEAKKVRDRLATAGVRAKLDDSDEHTPGWKFAEWEMRGVPLRLEIGPKDIEKKSVVIVERPDRHKNFIPMEKLESETTGLLGKIQNDLLKKATEMRENLTTEATDWEHFKQTMATRRGFIKALYDGTTETEEKIKEETRASVRVIVDENADGKCIYTGKKAKYLAYFAQSY